MSKFKFETGEVIEVYDDNIANLLRADKRYEEVVSEAVAETVETVVKKETKRSGKK